MADHDDNDDPRFRQDSWMNLLTGVGTPASDNRLSWVALPDYTAQMELEALWRADGLAGRIVELPADDMTRERGSVNLAEGLTEEEVRLQKEQSALGMWQKFRQAVCFKRAYGGAGIIMALDDGQPWDKPVNLATLRRVQALHLASPLELAAAEWYADPRNPKYGQPKVYRWSPFAVPASFASGTATMRVHQSRVLQFMGLETSSIQRVQKLGWADSILGRVKQRITDTMSAIVGAGVVVQDFSQAVLGLTGLKDLLSSPNGKDMLQRRIEGMRLARSALGVLIIDKEENYERKPTPIGGLAELLDKFLLFVSTETGIPLTILTGQAQTGLGDSTSPMTKVWEGVIRAEQNLVLRPAWEELTLLQLASLEGPTRGSLPEKLEVTFAPLSTLTPTEQADLEYKVAQKDELNITLGLYTAEDAARSHYSGPTFNPSVSVDFSGQSPLTPLPSNPADLPGVLEPATGAAPADAGETFEHTMEVLGAQKDGKLTWRAAMGLLTQPAPHGLGLGREQALELLGPDVSPAPAPVPGVSAVPAPLPVALPPSPLPSPLAQLDAHFQALLVEGVRTGALPEKEATHPLARLHGLDTKGGRALLRRELGRPAARADAEVTNFPAAGANLQVDLRNSAWPVFDTAYAQDLKENWPEVWALGGNTLGNLQFQRLLPVARAGQVESPTEEHAVRLREAWAARSARNTRPAGVVALVKWLVVGQLGEAGMRRVLEEEKDRVRRRRRAEGAPS